MAELVFSQVIIIDVPDKTMDSGTVVLRVPEGKIWKIESAGVAATNGTLYLHNGKAIVPCAILFSSTNRNMYSSILPFWLPESFTGTIVNESAAQGIISVSEWFSSTS